MATQLESSPTGPMSFSFAELLRRTPRLTGPERTEVFYALPRSLQWLAWRQLAESAGFRSQRDFEEQCR